MGISTKNSTRCESNNAVITNPIHFRYLLVYFYTFVDSILLGFLEQGQMVTEQSKLRRKYIRSTQFKLDVVSLLPTDLLYLAFGTGWPVIFRLNRLLRIGKLSEVGADIILVSTHLSLSVYNGLSLSKKNERFALCFGRLCGFFNLQSVACWIKFSIKERCV